MSDILLAKYNDNEIKEFANLTREYPIDVRFIELMPMHDNGEYGPKAYVPVTMVTDLLPELFIAKE